MAATGLPVKHRPHLLIMALVGALATMTFIWLLAAQAPARAAGGILLVPDEYPSIQAAIDAAAGGDEIRVVSGDYFERLVITKSIQLLGGWDVSFTAQTKDLSTVDAQGAGRGLTVSAAPIAPSVVISGFRFTNGDASGLGGVVTPTVPALPVRTVTAAGAGNEQPPHARAADLRNHLLMLAAQDNFPGGQAALNQLLARVDGLAAVTPLAATALAPNKRAAAATPAGEIDCGGGIFVSGGAKLHLMTVLLSDNVASRTGPGAGGAVCVVDAPTGGLILDAVSMAHNVASQVADGFGGGLYFAGGAAPGAQALHVNDAALRSNRASIVAKGYGGGAFVTGALAAHIEQVVFAENVATVDGLHGQGGGLFVIDSNDVTLTTVAFELNTAATTRTVPDPSTDWVIAAGGAICVYNTPGLQITSPVDDPAARTIFVGNIAAHNGLGYGGALYGENVAGIHIEQNDFLGNLGMVYTSNLGDLAEGGAIQLKVAAGAKVVGNNFRNNMVGLFNLQRLKLFGGALNIDASEQVLVANNRFESNADGTGPSGGDANGGAVSISAAKVITVAANTFVDNVAELGPSGGLGGALLLQADDDVLVQANTFLRNRAGTGAGIGGAMVVEASSAEQSVFPAAPSADETLSNRITVNGNTFKDNRAATNVDGDEALLGGAIAVNGANGLTLTNNVIAGNVAHSGSALALLGWNVDTVQHDVVRDAVVVNNTLAANAGENGLYMEMWTTPITLTNNVIVSHTLGIYANTNPGTGGMTVTVGYTVYNNNSTDSQAAPDSTIVENHAITTPVAFADFSGGDYHLQVISSARDAGDPAGVPPAPAADIEGTARPYGLGVDIGAYEWRGPLQFLPRVSQHFCPPLTDAGWAVGAIENGTIVTGTIVHTGDGGATWQLQALIPGIRFGGVKAVDADHAWVTGEPGTILYTADGGATWQRQALPDGVPPMARFSNITAIDTDHAWTSAYVDGQRPVFLQKVGDQPWTLAAVDSSLPITSGMQDISAADATHVWAAGTLVGHGESRYGGVVAFFDGQVWRRQGAGLFKNINDQTDIALIGINAVNATTAYVVGGGEVPVYATVDGSTWTARPAGAIVFADTNTIVHISPAIGWAGGDHGVIMHTSNGWQTVDRKSDLGMTISSITAKDADHVWAVSYNQTAVGVAGAATADTGIVARSCHGGIDWELQRPVANAGWLAISFVGARR